MEAGLAIAIGQVSANVLSIIWSYYCDVKDSKSNIALLATEIKDARHVIANFQDVLQHDPAKMEQSVSVKLLPTLEQSLADMELLEKKLEPGAGGKMMRRLGKRALKWPFSMKEVDDYIAKLQRLKTTLNLALVIDQTFAPLVIVSLIRIDRRSSRVLDIDAKVTDVKETQDVSNQDRQLERLLIAPGAFFNSYVCNRFYASKYRYSSQTRPLNVEDS